MHKQIYPCFWLGQQAAEAAAFYCTVFPNSRLTHQNAFVSFFEAEGQTFMCLNGPEGMQVNPSLSLFVLCNDAAEVDQTTRRLLAGGTSLMPLDAYPWSSRYAWVQDRFGVSWQVMLRRPDSPPQKFVPALLFCDAVKGRAEEAMQWYTRLFAPSAINSIERYGPNEGGEEGWVKHGVFFLGQTAFVAFDSAQPHGFGFNDGVSLVVECATQQEIDTLWDGLTAEGSEGQCGWLKDRYGLSWQIVPAVLGQLMSDPERMPRVSQAFAQMKKFDIAALENA